MEAYAITNFKDTVNSIIVDYKVSELEKAQLLKSIEKFSKMVNDELPPSRFFDIVAYGTYKECYDLSDNFIIKFCSPYNATEKEASILQTAMWEEMDKMFVPSEFICLDGACIPMTYLEDGERRSYYSDYGYEDEEPTEVDITYFEYAIIQPRVTKLVEDDNYKLLSSFENVYLKDPIVDYTTFEVIPYSALKWSSAYHLNWLQAILDCYGQDFFYDFLDFIDEEGIGDLHSSNIGFLNDKPVILDWLSA
jgi:hypothetical protein